jgi:hypothetical protein
MSLNLNPFLDFKIFKKKTPRSKFRQTNTLPQMCGGGWPGVNTQAKKNQEPKNKAKNPETSKKSGQKPSHKDKAR